MSSRQLRKVVRCLLSGVARRYGFLYLLATVSAALEVLSVGIVFPVLVFVVHGEDTEALPTFVAEILTQSGIGASIERAVMFLVVVFVLKNVFRFLVEYGNARITNEIRARWMNRLFEVYLYSHFQRFVHTRHGTMVHNLFELTVEALAWLKQLVTLFMYGISTAVVLAGLWFVAWQLTLASIVVVAAAYGIINRPLVRTAAKLGKERLGVYQNVTALPAEAFRGIREIKTYGATENVLRTYRALVQQMVNLRVRINFYQLLPGAFPEVVLVSLLAITLIVLHRRPGLDLSSILPLMGTYVYAAYRLFLNASVLIRDTMTLLANWPSVIYLAQLLDDTEYPEVVAGRRTATQADAITCHNVVFFYRAGESVIDGVSTTFRRGTLTAIVGDSGAGKSTLADLLIRIIEPQRGMIQHGAHDIAEYSLESWRRQIGFIGQETFLFHGTIAENIRLGKEDATPEEIEQAARQAQAHEFIERMPRKYETVVGERGSRLSGGQRQRIAIARALVRRPNVLVLDEATSALDIGNEVALMHTVRDLARDKIVILITHRLQAARVADLILVMKSGRIIESGSHGELVSAGGEYQRLWGTAGH